MNSSEDREKEELEKIRKYNKESVDLLKDHEWMEGEVVRKFLSICEVAFEENEVLKGEDPPDVTFRKANFEVTTVHDEGRKIQEESKNRSKRSDQATSLSDLMPDTNFKSDPLLGYRSVPPMNFSEFLIYIQESMDKKFDRYKCQDTCENLDLIVYVNLLGQHLSPSVKIKYSKEFLKKAEAQGWRSISFWMKLNAGVIFARKEAPSFIKCLEGVLKTGNYSVFED